MAWYPPYVPVGVRRARARRELRELRAQGMDVQPVEIRGRTIARSFWGRRWCEHLESFSDYANRLPRGRTYVRNGSVCHLAIEPGGVEALVAGRDLYHVVVRIKRLKRPAWKAIKSACAGAYRIGPRAAAGPAVRPGHGGRHPPRHTACSPNRARSSWRATVPDWATMCKHAAAGVLTGVGSRLDTSPELLFRLRGVDEAELIAADMALPRGTAAGDTLADGDLGDIFGIDLDPEQGVPAPSKRKPAANNSHKQASRTRKKTQRAGSSNAGATGAHIAALPATPAAGVLEEILETVPVDGRRPAPRVAADVPAAPVGAGS